MKFVVTGGVGFIGSHLTKFLVNSGHDVTVIDDLRRGNLENLKGFERKIDFQQINILDLDKLTKIVQNSDGIFHQAALSSIPDSFKDPEEYHRVNANGTENMLKLAKKFELKLVYASSSSVYGNQTKFPIKENAKKIPLNPYGKSKLEAEELSTKYAKEGVKVIGLRYFSVFGIGQNPNYAGVIPIFIERLSAKKPPIIEGDGEQIRDFIYVDDVVQANYVAFASKTDHGFFNIAGSKKTSINGLAKIMIKLSGLAIEPKYTQPRRGDIKISIADTSNAKKILGWESKISLENGLKKIFPKII